MSSAVSWLMSCLMRLASDRFRLDQTRLDRVQFGCVSRQLEDRQPGAGGDQLAHRAAGVGVQAVPDQDDRAAELLVHSVQEPCVVRLGEPLALGTAAGRPISAGNVHIVGAALPGMVIEPSRSSVWCSEPESPGGDEFGAAEQSELTTSTSGYPQTRGDSQAGPRYRLRHRGLAGRASLTKGATIAQARAVRRARGSRGGQVAVCCLGAAIAAGVRGDHRATLLAALVSNRTPGVVSHGQ